MDNVQLNENVSPGKIVATDEVSGVHHQLVKVEFGADGIATPVSTADPLPVVMSGDFATQTTLAAINTLLSSGIGVTFSNSTIGISGTLPLPTGAATESTLEAVRVLLAAGFNISDNAARLLGHVTIDNESIAVTGNFYPATQAVSVATLPLATGAASATNQTTANTSLASIDTKVATQTTLEAVRVLLAAGIAVTGSFYQAVQPVSAAALPLPTGASTEATLSTLNGKVPALGQALAAASVPVVLTSAQLSTITPPAAISGFATSAKQDSLLTEVLLKAKLTDTQPVSVATLPLPTGASSAANQTIGNNSLASIDGKLPATLGAKATAASMAVNIASDQVVNTKESRSTTPAQSSVSVTTSSTAVLALNANRLGVTIFNEGTATCYLILGSTASLTSYTLQLGAGAYYELPFNFTGAIAGITSSGTAVLRITELS